MANNLTVTYKGNTIHSASASGSATLETGGTWCEGDIGLSYTFEASSNNNVIELTVLGTTATSVTATKSGTTINLTYNSSTGVWSGIASDVGTWTIEAFASGASLGTSSVDVEDVFSTSIINVDSQFGNNSWAVIHEISNSGNAANYWQIGDRKSVTLNGTLGIKTFTNKTIDVVIIGFNHNPNYEGGKSIDLMFGHAGGSSGLRAFADAQYGNNTSQNAFNMNTTAYNNRGGWAASHMRNSICGTEKTGTNAHFTTLLPSDLVSAMKIVQKYTDNQGGDDTDLPQHVTLTNDYVFLPAEYEVFGVRTYAHTAEPSYQQQYAFFANGNSTIAYDADSTSTAVGWTLRSPVVSSGSHFCAVTAKGLSRTADAQMSRGITPCIRV